mgnify:CR=1 FL=1
MTKNDIIATAAALAILPLSAVNATPKPGNSGEELVNQEPVTDPINLSEVAEDAVDTVKGVAEDTTNAVKDAAGKVIFIQQDYSDEKLVDVIDDIESLETLSDLIDDADLEEQLNQPGPYTIFAPTNKAFEKLGEEKLEMLQDEDNHATLRSCLLGHVVDGKAMAADVSTGTLNTSASTEIDVKVTDAAVMVDDAKVIITDIVTSNGVIHMIDTVLTDK